MNDLKKEVFDLVENEYTFLDSYVNTDTKLRVRHNKCGHTYKVTPYHFFVATVAHIVQATLKKLMFSLKKRFMT